MGVLGREGSGRVLSVVQDPPFAHVPYRQPSVESKGFKTMDQPKAFDPERLKVPEPYTEDQKEKLGALLGEGGGAHTWKDGVHAYQPNLEELDDIEALSKNWERLPLPAEPLPRRRQGNYGQTKIQLKWQLREWFLEILQKGHTPSFAARWLGSTANYFYLERQKYPTFAERWKSAYEEGTDTLEEHALKMALEGNERLVIFLLRVRNPARFNISANSNNNHQFAPLQFENKNPIDLSKLSQEERDVLERILLTHAGDSLPSPEDDGGDAFGSDSEEDGT